MATPPPNRTASKHPHQPTGTPVSSQRYLDVAQIRDGVVVLRDGSLRAVVLVNAVNFALKSEEEQNALIYAYQGFLNSFNFPIQIVMQSRQLDLAHYIKKLGDQLAETTNELVALQISDYIQFIERLIQIANIMDKKFYVTVPFTPTTVRPRSWLDTLFNPGNRLQVRMSPAEFKSYRQELLERARIVMGGLSGMGLRSALLGTQEVIELLYATFNPEEATKERLSDVNTITGAYVHPTQADEVNRKPQTANGSTTAAVPVGVNPLATVAPELVSGNQQAAINNVQVASGNPVSAEADDKEHEPTTPTITPSIDPVTPIADSGLPIADEIALPEPLGPTAAAPAESPEAGRASPVTVGITDLSPSTTAPTTLVPGTAGGLEANHQPVAQGVQQPVVVVNAGARSPYAPLAAGRQPSAGTAPYRAPVLPTTGFGQPTGK